MKRIAREPYGIKLMESPNTDFKIIMLNTFKKTKLIFSAENWKSFF